MILCLVQWHPAGEFAPTTSFLNVLLCLYAMQVDKNGYSILFSQKHNKKHQDSRGKKQNELQ